MLKWNANFQIPNSGAQAAEVYAVGTQDGNSIVVNFYSDDSLVNLLFIKEYAVATDIIDIDQYLLTLDDFLQYAVI